MTARHLKGASAPVALVLAGVLGLLLAAYRDAESLAAPAATVLVVDRQERFLSELDGGDAPIGFWPLSSVPPRVAAALVGIEDQRFWQHPGVDLQAVARALVSNYRAGRAVSGASTLAMQVARMQKPGPRTYAKKLREALTALFLVARHGREAVLAHYLRIAPYGNRLRGIAFAARRYFDKPVEDLSYAEIAFLSALPQSPSRMNPYDGQGRLRAIRRGERILDALFERGVLDEVDLALARRQIVDLVVRPQPLRPSATLHAFEYFRGLTRQGSGPRWRASIDLELTAELQSILDDAVFRLSDRGVENGAVVVLERARHEVLAYVGSTDYFDASRTGAIDFAATLRPSGSTLKPFVYAAALDRGLITPATILDDLFRGPGSIENADRRFLGPMLPRTALANSRNVPAAQLVHELGLGPTYDGLRALRLHNREKPATHYGLGLALGLLPVRLIDLVTAYAALADDGRYAPPRFFVDEACTDCAERVLSAASSRQVTDFLSDPLARLPTFVRMGPTEYPFGVALKTGTSQGYRDAWTVLYTERHVLGVWLGRPDAQPMRQVGGATSAAVAKVMLQKLEPEDMRGLSDLGFAPPEGHTPTAICAWSGGRATPRCDQHFVEHFAPGQAPTHDCSVHVARAVGAEVRTLVDLPPRYASWAKSRGLDVLPQRAVDTSEPSPPRVLRPVAGTRVMQDPEMPKSAGTMALLAEVEGTRDPLVWYVDGVPFAVVAYPYAARWPLETGEHTFVARVHGRSSEPVKVIVDP